MPRYIAAQQSVPLKRMRKYFVSVRRFVDAYSMDGCTGDNVLKYVKALKKKQKCHRKGVEIDPEPKIRRASIKPFLEPQPHSSHQNPKVITLDDLDLDDSDTDESDMERDSEDTDPENIIVEE